MRSPHGCSHSLTLAVLVLLLSGAAGSGQAGTGEEQTVARGDEEPKGLEIQASRGLGEFPVSAFALANGLRVIVHEDHDIPSVALYLFFRVGSRNERPGITGISHFLEHMMFNGSKKYGPREFDMVMENRGGSNNAYTTPDVTVYSDWFSPSATELVLSMEAERLGNLAFDPAMVESERKVVLSERRTTVENDNFGFLYEQLYSTLYQKHAYRCPVLGWLSDIQSWTVSELGDYFRSGYGPSNCVMVVAGDITADRVRKLAEKYFTALPPGHRSPVARPAEPQQQKERRITVERHAQAPQQLFGYHVPASADRDYWPIEVTSAVLTSGRSSRLHNRLVCREQLAGSVSSWQRLSLDPGEFVISTDLKSGTDVERAERAVNDEVQLLRAFLISPRELRTAKNILQAEYARGISTINDKADWLGTYELFFGDYRKLFLAPREIERVTAADVQRVAQKYLSPANRTVATLMPAYTGSTREAAR